MPQGLTCVNPWGILCSLRPASVCVCRPEALSLFYYGNPWLGAAIGSALHQGISVSVHALQVILPNFLQSHLNVIHKLFHLFFLSYFKRLHNLLTNSHVGSLTVPILQCCYPVS